MQHHPGLNIGFLDSNSLSHISFSFSFLDRSFRFLFYLSGTEIECCLVNDHMQ